MDIHRAVTEFVSHSGRNLFHLLRSEGIMLSESELLALDVQLSVLENEVAITKMLKKKLQSAPPSHRSGVGTADRRSGD